MFKFIWLTIFTSIMYQLHGQNLIANPGFEQCDKCDANGFKELGIGTGANDPIDWTGATYGTPDIYSTSPRSGRRHGGFFLGLPKYEYFINHFTSCLQEGAIYKFSFWIRPNTKNLNYIIDEIGVYIQKGPTVYQQAEPLKQLKPQFESPDGEFIDQSGYREFSFQYTATGGEDHFIVGRFRALGIGDTTFIGSRRPTNPASEPIYYFVDDFEMSKISSSVDLIPDEIIKCPRGINQLMIPHPFNKGSILWSTGDTSATIDIPDKKKIYVEVTLNDACKTVLIDSSNITIVYSDTIRILSTDSLCLGDTIELNAICNECFEWRWNTNETISKIEITKPGWYEVTAKTICRELKTSKKIDTLNKVIKSFIEFPNVIVPSGEEKNRSFHPVIKESEENRIMSLKLNIYNRWGHKIFETTDIEGKWSPDSDMPMETYMYVCEIEYQDCNGVSKTFIKGTVTLIR